MIAIKKNRKEKGKRAEPRGSNPHSKGDLFSRSTTVFFARIEDSNITTLAKIKVMRRIIKIIMITLSDIYQTSRLEAEHT